MSAHNGPYRDVGRFRCVNICCTMYLEMEMARLNIQLAEDVMEHYLQRISTRQRAVSY